MKTKRIVKSVLLILALFAMTVSCKKDIPINGDDPEDNEEVISYEDPADAVTANLRNDNGYLSLFDNGLKLKINTANNFFGDPNDYDDEVSIVSVGAVDGLGYVVDVPQSGWSSQVAVTPGNGYVIRFDVYTQDYIPEVGAWGCPYFVPQYARLYVVRYIVSTSNEILGAEIKYQEYWDPITVTTKEVTEVTANSATIIGDVKGHGISITKGVCWSTTENPTISGYGCHQCGSEDGQFSYTITGLVSNTTYYVRAYVRSAMGIKYGEQKTFTTAEGMAEVTTGSVVGTTSNSAYCKGVVESDGGAAITARGVCWSTTPNPTINQNHTVDGNGTGSFSGKMTGLNSSTTYYVRAYATNSFGTAYGDEKTFQTVSTQIPTGAIKGLFSVSETQMVYFSQGNVQYQASTDTWRFAENQHDYVGEDNNNVSPTYDGWIDFFAWGSGSAPTASSYYWFYYEQSYSYADWGSNAIVNGGNVANAWKTMSTYEWNYVMNTRETVSGIRFAKANVAGTAGLIILPDNWEASLYNLNNTNSVLADYSSNEINLGNWTNALEKNGAVFLPAAGYRNGWGLSSIGTAGYYWSNTVTGEHYPELLYYLDFNSNNMNAMNSTGGSSGYFSDGGSVRLVQYAE